MKIKKVAQTPGVIATVSTSKIDSDRDTYSCNYINQSKTDTEALFNWKTLTTDVGIGSVVDLTSIKYKELYLEVIIENTNIFTMSLKEEALSNSEKTYRTGYYYNDYFNGAISILTTKSNIVFAEVYINKTNKTTDSSIKMNVYYR